MIINGKNVTGLFIYDKDATYERNDMVVDGTAIYVCSPIGSDSVKGEKPSESDNFYIYLCDRFETIEGYLRSIKTGELDVKAISIDTLQSILNHFMTGFDSKGVIGDCIVENDGNYEVVINGGQRSITNYNNILSDIMIGEDINNGILKVSGNLPELLIYGMSDVCILRQYTTYSNSTRIRVQELIDPVSGLIYLRSIKGNETPGAFKCSIVKSYKIKDQINKILEVYSSRIEYMNKLEESLKGNFRYRSINFPDETNSTTQDLGDSRIVTLLLTKERDGNGFLRTDNITIDLFYRNRVENPVYYIFGGENRLTIIDRGDGVYTFTTDPEIIISDITYREYYGT